MVTSPVPRHDDYNGQVTFTLPEFRTLLETKCENMNPVKVVKSLFGLDGPMYLFPWYRGR